MQTPATPEITGIVPLLQVFDMPTSIRFYRDTLGFALVSNSPPLGPPDEFGWVMLCRNGAELMLNTAYDTGCRPATPDPARLSAHADTILYLACPDVDAAFDSLLAKGLNLRPPKVTWYGMKQLYMKDPDGYSICYQWTA